MALFGEVLGFWPSRVQLRNMEGLEVNSSILTSVVLLLPDSHIPAAIDLSIPATMPGLP